MPTITWWFLHEPTEQHSAWYYISAILAGIAFFVIAYCIIEIIVYREVPRCIKSIIKKMRSEKTRDENVSSHEQHNDDAD